MLEIAIVDNALIKKNININLLKGTSTIKKEIFNKNLHKYVKFLFKGNTGFAGKINKVKINGAVLKE